MNECRSRETIPAHRSEATDNGIAPAICRHQQDHCRQKNCWPYHLPAPVHEGSTAVIIGCTGGVERLLTEKNRLKLCRRASRGYSGGHVRPGVAISEYRENAAPACSARFRQLRPAPLVTRGRCGGDGVIFCGKTLSSLARYVLKNRPTRACFSLERMLAMQAAVVRSGGAGTNNCARCAAGCGPR